MCLRLKKKKNNSVSSLFFEINIGVSIFGNKLLLIITHNNHNVESVLQTILTKNQIIKNKIKNRNFYRDISNR